MSNEPDGLSRLHYGNVSVSSAPFQSCDEVPAALELDGLAQNASMGHSRSFGDQPGDSKSMSTGAFPRSVEMMELSQSIRTTASDARCGGRRLLPDGVAIVPDSDSPRDMGPGAAMISPSEIIEQEDEELHRQQLEAEIAAMHPWNPMRCYKRTFPDGLLPRGSVHGSAFSLATVTLGAGTIAIPGAFNNSGAIISIVLLFLCTMSTVYSIRLLAIAMDRTKLGSYEQLGRLLIGVWFERLTIFMIIALCWGITMLYSVAMGDILENLRDDDKMSFPAVFGGLWGRRVLTTIYWACTMLPLSLVREVSTLRYGTFCGITATFVLVISLAAFSGSHGGSLSKVPAARLDIGFLMTLPVFIFSCSCQPNAFGVYAELKNKSVNRMTLVAIVAMAIVASVYIIAGISGVSAFGSDTKDNVLKNFESPFAAWYVAFSFFAICITLTLAFPMCIFPPRDAILQVLGYESAVKTPRHIQVMVAGGLACCSILIGLFIPGIDILLAILGGICGTALCFIWPCLFVICSGAWTVEKVGWPNVIGTWTLMIGGGSLGIMGTIITMYQKISSSA